jgi:phosphoribosylformylglycinamidine synthase
MEGGPAERWFPRPAQAGESDAQGERYGRHVELTHTLMKVETHNHPTAISPFAGAATGAGGEIRDEGATGRGARPKAGLTGFTVSNLELPGAVQAWENARDAARPLTLRNPNEPHAPYGRPDRIASPLQIMIDGPLGGAAFNNEFGRPNLGGYFRVYEQNVGGQVRGYHKPIMIAGGIGNISDAHTHKHDLPAGTLLVQIGGPGMRIGMGGGAASSMATGANTAELDFDSVQREAELAVRALERRAAMRPDVDRREGLGGQLVEQMQCVLARRDDAFGHPVVQRGRHGSARFIGERFLATEQTGQARLQRDREFDAALDAAHMLEPAVVRDVGGLARPR